MSTTTKQVTYDEKYSVGGSLSTPTAPVGYTFAGWRLESETGEPINDDTIVKTAKDHELHAIWSANKYILTVDANGGTIPATSGWTLGSGNTTATKTVTYDSQYGTLPTPTWSEHTFEGWHLGSVSGDKITSTTIMKTDSNHTIVAKWYINVAAPTASVYCTTPTYNGTKQMIVSAAPAGFTWSNHEQTDAKAYTVTAKIAPGYTWGGTDFADKPIECSISKRNITVTANNQSKTYDGSALTADATCTPNSGLVSGHTVTCSNLGSQTNAGSSTKTLNTVTIKNGSTDVTSNYNITKINGTLTVTKRGVSLSLDPTRGTLTYGTNATSTITTDSDGTLKCSSSNNNVATCSISGKTLTITPKANAADNQTATITVSQDEGTNHLAGMVQYVATVNRKTISAPSSPSAKTYNGSEQNSGITCPTGSTAGGEKKGTNAKEYTQTCTANSGYKFGSSDSCEVKWTISKKAVTIKGTAQSKTYDGSALSAANTCEISSGSLVSGHTMTCTCSGSQTTAGDGTKTVETVTIKNGSIDVTSNYNITKSSGTLTVNRAKTAATGSCNTGLVYNGNNQDLASGATNATYSDNTKKDAGTYTVTVTANSNYAFSDGNTSKTLSCSISAQTLGTPSVTITKTGSVTWGAVSNASSYQVSLDGGDWATASSGGKTISTSVGTHTASVRAVGEGNYATGSSGSDSATISEKITVSWKKTEKTCNGSYKWVYEDTLYPSTCNGTTTMSCSQESHVGNALVTCSVDRWTKKVTTCVENEDDYPISCSKSCPSTYTTTSTCAKKRKKTTTTCSCKFEAGTLKCSWGSSTTVTVDADDCTANAGKCQNGGGAVSKVECGTAYWTGAKSCSKTTYSTSSTTDTDQTICKAGNNFSTCNSSNVNKSNTTCTPSRYAKEVKNCEGTYSWGGTTTTPSVSSCSSNNISCGSSTVGKTYVGCSRNYGCGSGTTELGGNCINKT